MRAFGLVTQRMRVRSVRPVSVPSPSAPSKSSICEVDSSQSSPKPASMQQDDSSCQQQPKSKSDLTTRLEALERTPTLSTPESAGKHCASARKTATSNPSRSTHVRLVLGGITRRRRRRVERSTPRADDDGRHVRQLQRRAPAAGAGACTHGHIV